MVAILGEVRLPDGLSGREKPLGDFFSVNDVHCTSRVLLLVFIILTEHMKKIAFDSCLCAHLVNNPAGDTHAIENGHIDNGGHSSIVDGLRAVRPHVRTLCQVDVAWRQTGRRQGRQRILLSQYSTNVMAIISLSVF